MLKSYCQKCGALNAYVSEKPNFCQKCGTSFGNILQGANIQDISKAEIEEEEASQGLNFNMQGLEVDIDGGLMNTDKLGSIMGTANEGQKMEGGVIPAQSYTMEDFKREAGSIRGGNGPET
jgi:hypothetical protein